MANKKNYWLRLKHDFFKRHDIQILEAMPNGKAIVYCYLKLLCESISHDGLLRFSDDVAYTPQMLATVTKTELETVNDTIKALTDLKMLEIGSDGTMYLKKLEDMVGSTVGDEESLASTRERVRRHRERLKEKERNSNVTETLQKRYSNVTCNGEIDIEKDIDIEIDNIAKLSTLSTGKVSISDGSKFNKDYFDSIEV